ncbi:hypothetical protein ACHAXR_002660 [Thalassiosira sp. AJA248-18]
MSSYHAMAMAASRHGRRATLKLGAQQQLRPLANNSASTHLSSDYCSLAPPTVIMPSPPITMMASSARIPMGGSTSSSTNNHHSLALLATMTAASLAVATTTTLFSPVAFCEESNSSSAGIADESEEEGNGMSTTTTEDYGMDTGGATTVPKSSSSSSPLLGPADEAEDGSDDNTTNDNVATDNGDDDDDPSQDEDTTCSICLINRQGPCRKYWLKFERCMKEHSAEKDKAERREREAREEEEEAVEVVEEVTSSEGGGDDEKEDVVSAEAEKCDKFMIPWIGCIQEHRSVYSLISNAYYQKDYVDPLEDTVPDHRRKLFEKNKAVIGEECGYIMKYVGVEIDLGNWREHVEADADVDGNGNGGDDDDDSFEEEEESTPKAAALPVEEPHLINAYAKFKLNHPVSGEPIEVAYIKDQKGRLLGFDSFTKRDTDNDDGGAGGSENDAKDGDVEGSGKDASAAAATTNNTASNDGECTFHIVPGETTSIAAYAIYRGEKKDNNNEEEDGGGSVREDLLNYTPDVPLPGVNNQK